jgi:hypothetical protein
MKKTMLFLPLLFTASIAFCQIDVSQLEGTWSLKSVKFKNPVDLNNDGVKSADAYEEYNACQKDQQLEFSTDKSAKTYYGCTAKDCKPQTMSYTWQTKEQMIKEVQYENGKRVVKEKKATLLRLKDPEDMDSPVFVVISISKKELTIKGHIRDGSDSTAEAVMTFQRKKK